MKRKHEILIYGLNSCLKFFEKRPRDLIRVYVDEKKLKSLGEVLKYCAKEKIAYHIVSVDELNRISDSLHHEGVVFLIKEKPVALAGKDLKWEKIFNQDGCWLYLEDVKNPHNLGAIARSAAHFGVKGIFIDNPEALKGSFYRTSEGGAECVEFYVVSGVDDLLKVPESLKVKIYATTSHQKTSLYDENLKGKTLFILGAENDGIKPAHLKKIKHQFQIPGTNQVESLNVSVAAGICVAEWFRQNKV